MSLIAKGRSIKLCTKNMKSESTPI